jgi:hypothetical protein
MSDLRGLAERYVALSGQLEETRRAMLACLTNGARETAKAPFSRPTRPALGGRRNANGIAARAAEAQIIERLRERPMGTAELARATGAKVVTTQDRLRRLRARGEVVGGGADGWRAAAAPE